MLPLFGQMSLLRYVGNFGVLCESQTPVCLSNITTPLGRQSVENSRNRALLQEFWRQKQKSGTILHPTFTVAKWCRSNIRIWRLIVIKHVSKAFNLKQTTGNSESVCWFNTVLRKRDTHSLIHHLSVVEVKKRFQGVR